MPGHQAPFSGSIHDAVQRAADIIDILVPRPGSRDEAARQADPDPPDERARLIAVLRDYGETGPFDLSAADLEELRVAALELREVFAAPGIEAAAGRISTLLAARARPPRLTTHGGEHGWHLHVDSGDDAPWAEWFLTSSALALGVLLAERQEPPAGLCQARACGKPFVNTGRGALRRYCCGACGTRERVATHRGRRQPRAARTP